MEKGKLYLIPTPIAPIEHEKVLPAYLKEVVSRLTYFFVENERSARRFISSLQLGISIAQLKLFPLHNEITQKELQTYLNVLLEGKDAGVLSEAGCPAIADPGSHLVALAHQRQIQVVPLVGPSSILLALMASGFNGQSFAFVGYLPVKTDERKTSIRLLEKNAGINLQTQIFIETPYRNNQLVKDLLATCQSKTKLCIACELTGKEEWVQTKKIEEWRKNVPHLEKKPCIFLLSVA